MATLSFHAGTEGKTKRANLKGVLNHMLRKTMDKHKNHGNELIDPERTKNNLDWTKDKKPVDELVDERLEKDYKGKKKLRSDAVVLREIIVQPSADIFVGLSEAEKRQMAVKFTKDSLKWFDEEFGVENVMAASIHMDETNPHTHVMVMPMTEDGKLAQKEFFKGPADFKRQHREYREHMNARGWDFDLENKYENVDGVRLPHYKANAKEIEEMRLEQKKMIAELKSDPDVRKDAENAVYKDVYELVLMREQEELKRREKALKEREERMEAKEKELQEKEQRTSAVEAAVRDVSVAAMGFSPANHDKKLIAQVNAHGLGSVEPNVVIESVNFGISKAVSDKRADELDAELRRAAAKHKTAKPEVPKPAVQQVMEDDGPEL